MRKKLVRIFGIFAAVIVALGVAFTLYVNDYYHVSDKDAALADTELAKLSKTELGYFFDGPGEDSALIFYPGAKVEDLAYDELLKQIAAGGADCFLVHMPFNLAFFGINRANEIIGEHDYTHWYLAGHSLGGAMAAGYCAKNGDKLDGLILLAAYSASDISTLEIKTLSIYGSEDKVLNKTKLEDGREFMPDGYEELVINGGNHAGFGDYGAQRGDGEERISGDEQKAIAAERILECINDLENS